MYTDDIFAEFDEQNGPKEKRGIKKEEQEASTRDEVLKRICKGRKRENEDPEEESKKKQKIDEITSSHGDFTRIQVHKVESQESCFHEVAIPHDMEFTALTPIPKDKTPPKEYPFILDPFQKESILCLENTQSVLVSAHTSAGKTVVAEYAIAMSLARQQRVIYTTPIKALSNQKYREFLEEFKDVGLLTGDVTINPLASCLIMTTEILRSMLYRGSEILKEVGWVIFDEIHYMRDPGRGVVWEETIILLPDTVKYVFLSATIPNATQFAEWVCYLHHQPCHVVYTEYRPVPLQHYAYPTGGKGLHLIVDESGKFLENNYNKAMAGLKEADEDKPQKRKSSDGVGCYKLVQLIMENNLSPVIVFSFSRKECEAYAVHVSKLDLTSDQEKKLVEEIFSNALDVLSDEDRNLPQVQHVFPLLKRGIGIHHSGLLPILKETVEILFAEGLIKALFATETFAMGLNMPARTVLFTSTRKFDGKENRFLTSGEYIQMSGRAGRRGLDDKGIVISMVDEQLSCESAKKIINGQTDVLNSAFYLSYNMILNLLRVDGINPEYMMQRSFFQFQNHAALPQLQKKLIRLTEQHHEFTMEQEAEIASYHVIRKNLDSLEQEIHSRVILPQNCLPFLQPGRMIKVKRSGVDFGWGIVVNLKKKTIQPKGLSTVPEDIHIVDVLMHLSSASLESKTITDFRPAQEGEAGEMRVFPVSLKLISHISSIKLRYPRDLKSSTNRASVLTAIRAVLSQYPQGPPMLHPITDMKIQGSDFNNLYNKFKMFEERMVGHHLHNSPLLESLLKTYSEKAQLSESMQTVKAEIQKKQSLLQMEDLTRMKRVLRKLGYCTPSDVVELKGRVACEISSAHELLLTEMIFDNTFNQLSPAQMAALLSCFVFEEKSNEMPKLTEELSGPLRDMQKMAKSIAKVSVECRLEMDEQKFVESFKPHLMDAVFAWCNGSSFSDICKMAADVFEGSVIRSMRRLEELLRQMAQACKTIGNKPLEDKFLAAIVALKRDIVFAASLYL